MSVCVSASHASLTDPTAIRPPLEYLSTDIGCLVFDYLNVRQLCQLSRISTRVKIWSLRSLRDRSFVYSSKNSQVLLKTLEMCPKATRILKTISSPVELRRDLAMVCVWCQLRLSFFSTNLICSDVCVLCVCVWVCACWWVWVNVCVCAYVCECVFAFTLKSVAWTVRH